MTVLSIELRREDNYKPLCISVDGEEVFSGWLSNATTGFIGLLILTVWQLSGYMMIVYIAQIQQIPESVKEAARIDGAGSWAMLKKIIHKTPGTHIR